MVIATTILISTLPGCRYYSLYQFAEQFCEFDARIIVQTLDAKTTINFDLPLVPRPLLIRYLKAAPSLTRDTEQNEEVVEKEDLFQIVHLKHNKVQDQYLMTIGYSKLDETSLLASAEIDDKLSSVFGHQFAEAFLRTACTDNFSLSFSQIEVHFDLSTISDRALPILSNFETVFGRAADKETDDPPSPGKPPQFLRRTDIFDFLLIDPKGNVHRQHREATLNTAFDEAGTLRNMHIQYMNYRMDLDFESDLGQLTVIR